MSLRLTILTILFALSPAVKSQNVSIRASLDTNSIMLGEQTHFSISVKAPVGVTVAFPALADTLTGKVDVLPPATIDTNIEGNVQRLTQRILITSFDSGQYTIPALPVVFRSGTQADTFTTNPVYLMVYTLPVDTTKEIFDIKPQAGAPVTWQEIGLYGGIGLFVILLAIGIYILIKRRKTNTPLFGSPKPKIPPYEQAISMLNAIKSEKLWQQGKVKEFYTRLTDVVRMYLELEAHIPALEQITWEIVRELKQQSFPTEIVDLTNKLLQEADLVKFAKSEPLPDQNDLCLQDAYRIVEGIYQYFISKREAETPSTNSSNHV